MNSHKQPFFIGSLLVGAIFLSVSTPLPLIAQEATVTLKVCNAAAVGIDVFTSRPGKVSNSHIGPADCAVIAESVGAMGSAYVGFAFADSRGQWGVVRRQDFLPLDSGFLGVMTQVQNQTVPVTHGNTTLSLPMQLLFQPPVPICHPYVSSMSRLGPFATRAEIDNAQRLDNMVPNHSTYCDQLGYTLNVLAYPDSREITFKKFCDSCDKKAAARITPEERAAGQRRSDAVNQVMGGMAASSPLGGFLMGNVEKQGKKYEQEEQRERQKELEPPQQVNWNDMGKFLSLVFRQDSTQPPVNKRIIVQGTVSRVDLLRSGSSHHRVNVYFKESPETAFDMCTARPEVLQDLFGPDFSSRMIGRTVVVEGEVTKDNCESRAGIWVTLSHQLHVGGSGQVRTATTLWKPPDVQQTPAGRPPVQEYPYDPGMPSYSVTSKMADSALRGYCSGIYDPAFPLLTSEQIRFKYANSVAIDAELKKCLSSFDLTEVAAHRRIAMRYCLGNNNYTDRLHHDLLKPYAECMYRNDTLTAFCTLELKYRAGLGHMPNVADQRCPAPMPNGREALVILRGGSEDMGHPVVIPSTGPGLPAILLSPMEPGILQRAGASTANERQVAAPGQSVQQAPKPTTSAQPIPAPSPASSAAPGAKAAQEQLDRAELNAAAQEKRQQRIAEHNMQVQEYAACRRQAAKDHPEGGANLVTAFRPCIQALTQRSTTSK